MSILEDVKTLLDIDFADTTHDAKLNIYIRKSVTNIKNYLQVESDIEQLYTDAIIELTLYCYRNMGKGDIKSESQGSRSVTYQDNSDLIPSFVKALLPLPNIRMMG